MLASREISQDIRDSATAVSLIQAGIEQFSLYGQKATTRNVAEHANANIAAIPYYFRNKNGLYNACMHYIVDEIWHVLGQQLKVQQEDIQSFTKQQAKDTYLGMMDAFCRFFLQDPDTLRWSQFVMREHATPTEAYEIFYQRYYQHAQKLKCKLLAICLDADEHDDAIQIQSHALFGQALGFLIARESLLRGLGVTELSSEHVDTIRSIVRRNLCAVIEPALK